MDTNETKSEATRALTCPALDSEAWAEWMPEIQNAGVDTLEFSFDVEIGQAMWDRLDEEKAIAQILMQTRKAEHVPDWLNAVVHPVGAKGGYRFLLETPTFSIKLLKGVRNRPPIYVEMRAYRLHTHEGGAIGACEAACAFIWEALLAEEDPEWTAKVINLDVARCSRLDLFLDWQGGWHPTFKVDDETAFIKRVQREADVANLGDLLLYSLDDLEDIAREKGGIRQLLDEKWRKVYKASTPRGVFTASEVRAA